MDKIAIPCNCGCSVVLVMEFEELGDHPQEFVTEFFTAMDLKGSRRIRWQTAWRILRGKDPWLHDVCLDSKAMGELQDFLAKKLSTENS